MRLDVPVKQCSFCLWRHDMFMVRHHGHSKSIRHSKKERERVKRKRQGAKEDQVSTISWHISFSLSLALYFFVTTGRSEKERERANERVHATCSGTSSNPRALISKQCFVIFEIGTSPTLWICFARSESFNGKWIAEYCVYLGLLSRFAGYIFYF